MAAAPTSSAAPSAISTFCCAAVLSPSSCSRKAPRNAIGTEPSTIQPTRRRFTVPLCRCTAAPTGRISTAATRSLEIAADGLTPNSRISIGVISAPAAGAGQPDQQPDHRAAEDDIEAQAHPALLPHDPTVTSHSLLR